jgi:hypothetical protein
MKAPTEAELLALVSAFDAAHERERVPESPGQIVTAVRGIVAITSPLSRDAQVTIATAMLRNALEMPPETLN